MGLFDSLKGAVGGAKSMSFTFDSVPESVAEMSALLEKNKTSEFYVAALAVLALCKYEENPQTAIDMLNALKGPQPLSPYETSFIKDRLAGKGYKPRSFFDGATTANNYEPSKPYTISVSSNPYSYDAEGYATLYLKSSGADSERPIKLRKKPSTGEWFVWEIQFLSDIRVPAAADPWA